MCKKRAKTCKNNAKTWNKNNACKTKELAQVKGEKPQTASAVSVSQWTRHHVFSCFFLLL